MKKTKEQRQNNLILKAETIIPLIVALTTFLVFLGALRSGFLNWDDTTNFIENSHFRGFGWSHLRWMFASPTQGNYEPLSWLFFAAIYAFWGMNPLEYHLSGVVLHVTTAVMLYYTIITLLKSRADDWEPNSETALCWSAGLATLFFALHPLRAEVVAWVSGQHYAFAAIFFLASIWSYLKSLEPKNDAIRHRRWLVAAFISYVLSLLASPGSIALPLVLLILDGYLSQYPNDNSKQFNLRSSLWGKIPFFIAAVPAGIATMMARPLVPIARYGVIDRLSIASFGLIFYIDKTFVPLGLSPLYPLPGKINPLYGPFILCALLVILITILAVVLRRWWPAGIFLWGYYIVTLLPVLGLFQSGLQLVADRYSYFPAMGLSALMTGALTWLWKERGPSAWRKAVFVVGIALAVLSCLTWREIEVWHDSENLWRHVLNINPNNALAQNNLGSILLEKGKADEAIQHYDLALQILPNWAWAQNNLGAALAVQGKLDEAIRQYNLALLSQPELAEAHKNMGKALAAQGKLEEAIYHYNLAIRAKPDYAETYNYLGLALVRQGKIDEAINSYNLAIRIKPDYAEAFFNRGLALTSQGKIDEAIHSYNLAILAKPDYAEAHSNLGLALANQGYLDEAIRQYNLALISQPDLAETQNNLGNALAAQGKLDEAIEYYNLALHIRPDYAEAHINLGNILATQGKLQEAVQHYHQALQIDPRNSSAHHNLAIILNKLKQTQ